DDGGPRGVRQNDVGFGDAADAAMKDLGGDFVSAELAEGAIDGFERTLHIGLDEERKQPLLAVFLAFQELIEGLARGHRLTAFAALAAAIFGDLASPR